MGNLEGIGSEVGWGCARGRFGFLGCNGRADLGWYWNAEFDEVIDVLSEGGWGCARGRFGLLGCSRRADLGWYWNAEFDEVTDVLSESGCKKFRPYEDGDAGFDEATGVLSEVGWVVPAGGLGFWKVAGGRI